MQASYIIIATGGYLKDRISVEKLELSDDSDDFEDFNDFDEYVDYNLQEAIAEYEQHFVHAIAIKESEAIKLIKELKGLGLE